tara:strand:+ start:245 stop:550 length:306 start_codon:yes stop_codon:yes gene_type:complete
MSAETKAEADYRRAVEAGIIVPVTYNPALQDPKGEWLSVTTVPVKETRDVITGDSFKDLYLKLKGELIQLRQALEETTCQESVFTYQQVVKTWLEKNVPKE